jgi:hypothetical protein
MKGARPIKANALTLVDDCCLSAGSRWRRTQCCTTSGGKGMQQQWSTRATGMSGIQCKSFQFLFYVSLAPTTRGRPERLPPTQDTPIRGGSQR